jgi:hypothetical protein
MTPSPRRNRDAWVLLFATLLAFRSAAAENPAQSGVAGGDDLMSISLDQLTKLRGSARCSLGHSQRSLEAMIPIHADPTELDWAFGVVVAANMTLLTELGLSSRVDFSSATGRLTLLRPGTDALRRRLFQTSY